MVVEDRWQEPEACGRIMFSKEAEKDEHWYLLAVSFLLSLGPQPMEWCYPHLR